MHEPGKSDSPIVPKKVSNKARPRAAERLEGRGLGKRNLPQATRLLTQSRAYRTQSRACLGGLRQVRQATEPTIGEASRQDASQEPGAVVPHARICGGGGQQWLSLLR